MSAVLDTSASPPYTCLLCRRKFPCAEALTRHELTSDLHQQNLERQDEIVQKQKQDVYVGIMALRQQLHELAGATQQPDGNTSNRQTQLEIQLRQLLGEFGQAQEMLEYSRHAREAKVLACEGAEPRRKHCQAHTGCLAVEVGACSWQGGKESQEDRYILNLELSGPAGVPIIGCCVLDGHAGSTCVDHIVERLQGALQAAISAKPTLTEENLKHAVSEACLRVDAEFLAIARQKDLMDGSTMILALMYEASSMGSRVQNSCRLLVANVGDSRAVLCRAGAAVAGGADQLAAVRLSQDHKPDRPDEKQRIQSRGGVVDFHGVWRVFMPSPVRFGGRLIPRWGLAVSRAFGDLLLKEPERYDCNHVTPGGLLTAEPECTSLELNPQTDRFFILACDGVWDVLRDEDAVAVCAGQAGSELAAHALVRHAFAAGSGDNLTALVVALRPGAVTS